MIKDITPPDLVLNVPADSGLILPISWTGSDDLSGVARYDIRVRAGEGVWTDWLTGTQRTEAEFVGSEGITYTFQVRAADRVGNTSAWTTSGSCTVQGVTKYYYFGSQRVALRRGSGAGSKVYYLHGDHPSLPRDKPRLFQLGDTDGAGNTVSESRYAPFGELRWTRGASLTDFSFTGQRRDGFGLLDYRARFYSPLLGRFISADTMVPDVSNPTAWDRYSYGYGNPVKYMDPSGHVACWDENYDSSCEDPVNNPYGFKSTTVKKKTPTHTSRADFTPGPTLSAIQTQLASEMSNPFKPYQIPPTMTPTPEYPRYLELTPTSEPLNAGPRINIDINWEKVDKVEALTDIAGIVGESAKTLELPGVIAYGVTEVAEFVGFANDIKNAIIGKDPSGLILDLSEQNLNILVDFGRLAPQIGIMFNIASIYLNIRPATTISIDQ